MAKRKLKNKKILLVIFILLLFVGTIAGFAIFIKNSVPELSDSVFYLKIDGKMIFNNAFGYTVNADNPLKVEVKNKLFVDEKPDYHIEIDADSSLKFAFVKDGKLCYFTPAEDVTSFFDITETVVGFELTSKGDSIDKMLECLYPDSNITVDNIFDYSSTMFWLTVILNEDVQSYVKVGFSLRRSVDSISLDIKEIIF